MEVLNKMLKIELNIFLLRHFLLRRCFKLLVFNEYLTSLVFREHFQTLITIILLIHQNTFSSAFPVIEPTYVGFPNESTYNNNRHISSNADSMKISTITSNGYLDKLDNLERSVAAVLIKVAYGTTSTTKRSIPENTLLTGGGLTTIATPLLTTLRYFEKFPEQQHKINFHQRSYEFDLEKDHALPTSAPNADILKSNSNPTYPNPNRHHNNHDRGADRLPAHVYNSTPLPALLNIKKNFNQSPTLAMQQPGEMPLYSPPARSFFTPPLPPEYQNPFADKPTLRGTNNEGIVGNTGSYINRRPIPPPSLMPGHERIPLRPPDLAASTGGNSAVAANDVENSLATTKEASEHKKVLNTPFRGNDERKSFSDTTTAATDDKSLSGAGFKSSSTINNNHNTRKEVLPSIRRILSGANGKRGDVPEVLLKHVTIRPAATQYQYQPTPASPIAFVENTSHQINNNNAHEEYANHSANINQRRHGQQKLLVQTDRADNVNNFEKQQQQQQTKKKLALKPSTVELAKESQVFLSNNFNNSTPAVAAAAVGDIAAISTTSSTTGSPTEIGRTPHKSTSSRNSSPATATAITAFATWNIAWHIHVYLSVILFTILAVFSLYKLLVYNKLSHLFTQSYFITIHLTLITICTARIFYLCYDAYNIHASFHNFISELLLNLPATFMTISFSVLILFLFLKSLNHKNNRYSALIRPLTVVVGCGVHVLLCITLHYVESYTTQNQQQLNYQQQQQQLYRRQQYLSNQYWTANVVYPTLGSISNNGGHVALTQPPRVLSLICQIIYIFICFSLGVLYLYIYRILKKVLRNKSQNYIHGYQNLSYAIHITIATALLFVLLAALQIFGAISISSSRTFISQVTTTTDVDWLQWGYQFSLRLIEVAIITLISWVAGLKTNGCGGGGTGNGDTHIGADGSAVVSNGEIAGSRVFGTAACRREKQHIQQHTNIAGYFLPCTSSSSQEQFETDYPVVCNANTNLHTYTMRTGKLIYDDSFALSSIPQTNNTSSRNAAELQLQAAYQRPYDTKSLQRSPQSTQQNIIEYATDANSSRSGVEIRKQFNRDNQETTEYLTDTNTDHYETPNFDLLRTTASSNTAGSSKMQKQYNKTSTSTTASSSRGSESSPISQQQMLLLHTEGCYAEPILQQNFSTDSNYDFTNFERPNFNSRELWPAQNSQHLRYAAGGDKKPTLFERFSYENPERRSANSSHSSTSNGGGGDRTMTYNSFERKPYNMRKSGTLNNINRDDKNKLNSPTITLNQRNLNTHMLAATDRQQQQNCCQQQQRFNRGGELVVRDRADDFGYGRSSLDRVKIRSLQQQQQQQQKQQQQQQQQQQHYQEQQQNTDSDDMMSSVGNAECSSILINNEVDGSCATINVAEHIFSRKLNSERNISRVRTQNKAYNPTNTAGTTTNTGTTLSTAPAAESVNSSTNSMLVADHGFVRFRALDDINNAQGVGIHNATVRNANQNTLYLKASG